MTDRAQGIFELLIRSRAAEHPDSTWLLWEDEEVSWATALSAIQRVANGLLGLGIRPGDRIALMMGNKPEFLWAHFAAGFIGASTVPVNISQRGPALSHILADSGAACAIVDDELRDVVSAVRKEAAGLAHAVVVGGKAGDGFETDFDHLLDGDDREPSIDVTEAPTGAAMLYTSGTTGPPKGVVQKGAAAGASGFLPLISSLGIQPGETIYTALPLFHGNALLISTTGSMVLDARLALGRRFSASRLFDETRKYGAVEFNALGGMITILLKQPPRDDDRDNPVRVVLSAGCPAERWVEFEERFGVKLVEFYGLVDAPGLLLNDSGRVGSMGRPIGECEFAVMSDGGELLGSDEVGEVVFKHPAGQLSEYHNLPEATESAWRDGWFHTGDLAARDVEGFYYYKGRKKESIRRLGENISAWEIETVANQHPKVLESAAHAVPSELGEDEVKLCVVEKPGESVDPVELGSFLEGRVARYAVPRYIEIMAEIPKTPTHRVRYQELKDRGVTTQTWDRTTA